MSNLPMKATYRVPVQLLLARNYPIQEQIAGLLDYGYSPLQIGEMLDMCRVQVEQIMRENHYVTVPIARLTGAGGK